jgi:hypothetical protein
MVVRIEFFCYKYVVPLELLMVVRMEFFYPYLVPDGTHLRFILSFLNFTNGGVLRQLTDHLPRATIRRLTDALARVRSQQFLIIDMSTEVPTV